MPSRHYSGHQRATEADGEPEIPGAAKRPGKEMKMSFR